MTNGNEFTEMSYICENCTHWRIDKKKVGVCTGYSENSIIQLFNTRTQEKFEKRMILRTNEYDSCINHNYKIKL